MIAIQNAYEILGVGVITVEDLDKGGLSVTADALIEKVYLELLEVHQTKKEGDLSSINVKEITSAYSKIGKHPDRLAYNDFMQITGSTFESSNKNMKEASAIRQLRQVSFNIDLKKNGICEETRYN